jgi:hypothetical protein
MEDLTLSSIGASSKNGGAIYTPPKKAQALATCKGLKINKLKRNPKKHLKKKHHAYLYRRQSAAGMSSQTFLDENVHPDVLFVRGRPPASAFTRRRGSPRARHLPSPLPPSPLLVGLEREKKFTIYNFRFSVFGFQSPNSPNSPSSAGFAGEAARRRRFFWPNSPSHPSKLYSSLGWLNSKVPKPFPPFSLRLIDVDGFYSWDFMEFREFN